MRNNQPITQHEHLIADNITIVSKTDLHGTIIECNDAFEEASGFRRDQLIGQSHNMVRHPDMPAQVFADMWADLKLGIPWSGYVKNRHFDGGFYWVHARATPLYKNNQITGFMSLRTAISEQEKQQAQQDYQALSHNQATIKHGVIRQTKLNRDSFNLFSRWHSAIQLGTLGFMFSLLPIASALLWPQFINLTTLSLLSASLMIFMLSYGVALEKSKQRIIKTLRAVAAVEPINTEPYDPNTYNGQIHNVILSASLAFREALEENHYQLDKANQLRYAVDRLKSSVMMVDADFNITYMNKNMRQFFDERETKIKQLAPQFDAKKLIGENIDVFHAHPEHQRAMINKMQDPTSVTIQVGSFHLELALIPIKNRTGHRVATLVEWIDRTQDVQLIHKVGATVKKAQQGYLGERIDVSELEGVAHELSTSINHLMDGIQTAMNDVIRVTSAMAQGDLTQTINNDFEGELGELKQAINTSIQRLDNVIEISINAAQIVDGAAHEVSQGSHDLSDRVHEQVNAVEQSSETIAQMNSTIRQNNRSTQSASQVAKAVQSKAQQGTKVMGQTIGAMEYIQESSHKIADIVTIIDGIAFQTNLLALNAAVEAARAGDHGRGFAVVAGEVRNLAQKSAEAAKEIKQLIDESVERIDQGTRLAAESGKVLKDISDAVDEVTEMIQQVAQATENQAQGIQQVNDAIAKIDQITQQNSALVEQTSAASESMREQANFLNNEMNFFTTSQGNHHKASTGLINKAV